MTKQFTPAPKEIDRDEIHRMLQDWITMMIEGIDGMLVRVQAGNYLGMGKDRNTIIMELRVQRKAYEILKTQEERAARLAQFEC